MKKATTGREDYQEELSKITTLYTFKMLAVIEEYHGFEASMKIIRKSFRFSDGEPYINFAQIIEDARKLGKYEE